ncbi:hypothetical protein [Pedobacter metabolipauper]|uniref:Uncharacterized protein n=1 Tax=Pedobacter metabolipauper TaxID=425513 RepID=A0A4R6SVW8_9SPHI|nr:hypothetical protein [Pedobacter metabolipauper]TDQ08262.1 hypothetical protein ATK78_2770 [Pedobacter metabolipauper]
MKRYYMIVTGIIILLMSACKKEGELVIKPIRSAQTLNFRGFVLGDTLEQYFDGRKLREFYATSFYNGRIVFDKEGPVLMELKRKGDNKVLYSKNIEQDAAATDKPVSFYYDGVEVKEKYSYPEAIPGIEQIAFYFDFPSDMPADIVYGDASGDVNSVQYLARNVQPKQWVDFLKIPPLDGQELYVFLLKAGKKEFLIDNNFELSYLQANLPLKDGYPGGGVQSLYFRYVDNNGTKGFQTENLVNIFPR